MGSHTKFFGTVLAMLAVNGIYLQLQQLALRLEEEVNPAPSEQAAPEPQSNAQPPHPWGHLAQVFRGASFVGIPTPRFQAEKQGGALQRGSNPVP
ncbi:hypothetical protein [Synechococcus sp. H65.1]|uniref:hypothetical protein n=1 Tax=unclassified Synechococcus TaxID=2626047 RepID=UPI0039C35D77